MPRKCFVFGGLPHPLFVGAVGIGVDWLTSGWWADDFAEADGVNVGNGLTSGCWLAEVPSESDGVNGREGLTDG